MRGDSESAALTVPANTAADLLTSSRDQMSVSPRRGCDLQRRAKAWAGGGAVLSSRVPSAVVSPPLSTRAAWRARCARAYARTRTHARLGNTSKHSRGRPSRDAKGVRSAPAPGPCPYARERAMPDAQGSPFRNAPPDHPSRAGAARNDIYSYIRGLPAPKRADHAISDRCLSGGVSCVVL
jgi:hypothetical protein